jgi:serine/threonine protein kinase
MPHDWQDARPLSHPGDARRRRDGRRLQGPGQRFTQEAKAASALNHPHILTIHDIASDGGIDFIAMEYVAGKTLDQVIRRHGIRLNEA